MANISSSEESLAVIRAISGIGRALGLVVTAEGVETREQLDLIRAEGCTAMQGYFLSPPVTADDLRNRILANPVNAVPPQSHQGRVKPILGRAAATDAGRAAHVFGFGVVAMPQTMPNGSRNWP